ncbi:hypothetical protein ACHWQZ_G003772 [Mnemiopsis leidyi]
MTEGVSSNINSDLSLEDMVSTLHTAHLAQQRTLAELDATISTLQIQIDSSGEAMKEALSDQTLLSKENIWLTKDIKLIECEILNSLEMELYSLVLDKNSELLKIENLKKKQKVLRKLKETKTLSIESYMKDLLNHSSKFITEEEMLEQGKSLDNNKKIEKNLIERIRSTDERINETSNVISMLETQDKVLHEESEQLMQEISQRRSQVDKAYDDQVKALNDKMTQLQSIHSAHKNQLRDLNRIISSLS